MLADAIAAEGFKLVRNRWTLFWAFLFPPLVALVTNLVSGLVFARLILEKSGLPAPPMNIPNAASHAFAAAASPLTILFCLIGAAVLFAGEYRWETWRLMAPRNTRANHILGKAVVYALWSLVTVLLIGLAGLVSSLITAPVLHSEVHWTLSRGGGGYFGELAGNIGIAWLQLLQAGAVAAIAAVLTRSMIGAIMVPIGLGILQAFVRAQVIADEMTRPAWWRLFTTPEFAFDYLRKAIADLPLMAGPAVPAATVALSLLALATWLIAGYGGAVLAFQRQDLSKE